MFPRIKEKHIGYYFVLPAFLLLIFVIIIPIINAFIISFQHRNQWGIDNYIKAFNSPDVANSWIITLIFVIISTLLQFALGFIGALLLNNKTKNLALYRTMAFIPWIISIAITGTLWRWLYHIQYGAINDALLRIGVINIPIPWMEYKTPAIISVIIANTWSGFPFIMLILLAGLKSIPQEQYEAAVIDGASSFQVFRYITVPNLKLVMNIGIVLILMKNFRAFGLVNVITEGGPGGATRLISLYIYRQFTRAFDFGYASANGILLLFAMSILIGIYIKIAIKTD